MVVARELTRTFGDFTAVDHVSFTIERGEIFGFVGSNGCGKTTTMKMLTGLLPASAGEAFLFGEPINAADMSLRRRVGYMSQSFSLYSELTVRQNLDLHARLFHIPREKAGKRIAALLIASISIPMPATGPRACRSASASVSLSRWPSCTSPIC